MDFRQTTQPTNNRPGQATVSAPINNGKDGSHKRSAGDAGKWMKLLNIIVLFGAAILIAAIAFSFTRGSNDNEFKYVDNSKYQAVFLNNGQVYFGNIDSLNGNYVRLTNIYYLTQSSSTGTAAADTTNGNYSLVKLGCQQIHDPYDQMLINRSQVTFWENLQDSGKVVTSIKQFIKQNPKGPDCSQVSSQTQASSGTGTQGAATTGTGTATKP